MQDVRLAGSPARRLVSFVPDLVRCAGVTRADTDATDALASLRPCHARQAGGLALAIAETTATRLFETGTFGRSTAEAVNADTLFYLLQNGVTQRAPRRDVEDTPRTEVTLDAATLAGYAGRYRLAPAFELTVTIEDGAVFAQATNQPKFPIFAEAPDRFFYKVVDAQLTFDRDSSGKVTGLILHQNGRDLRGTRLDR